MGNGTSCAKRDSLMKKKNNNKKQKVREKEIKKKNEWGMERVVSIETL